MIIMRPNYRHWLGILASIFLGMTFVVAGIGKFLGPAKELEVSEVLLVLLVIMELAIGLLLVAGICVRGAAIFSLPLVAGFITSNILMITLGQEECLSCFGAMGKLSAIQALYLDGIMVALAVMVLIYYPGRFFSVRPWYWGK